MTTHNKWGVAVAKERSEVWSRAQDCKHISPQDGAPEKRKEEEKPTTGRHDRRHGSGDVRPRLDPSPHAGKHHGRASSPANIAEATSASFPSSPKDLVMVFTTRANLPPRQNKDTSSASKYRLRRFWIQHSCWEYAFDIHIHLPFGVDRRQWRASISVAAIRKRHLGRDRKSVV